MSLEIIRTRFRVAFSCWLVASAVLVGSSLTASARLADLSNGTVVYPPSPEPWAVYAYDPDTAQWTALGDISWRQVTSFGHSSYVVEATATQATAASTYRVVLGGVLGAAVEVFMVPDVTQRLTSGQTTTLTIKLF